MPYTMTLEVLHVWWLVFTDRGVATGSDANCWQSKRLLEVLPH